MKTTIIAAILALSPAIGFAMGCSSTHEVTMTCADGTMWNAETSTCVPLSTS